MPLKDILIRTKVAEAGMSVKQLLEECFQKGVQSLPYCDENGRVVGRVTIKNVIQQSIIPDHVAQLAHVMPSEMDALKNAELELIKVLKHDVSLYRQAPHVSVTSDCSFGKALAVMEHHDTSYLFVVDDGKYVGTLSIQGIARHQLELTKTSD